MTLDPFLVTAPERRRRGAGYPARAFRQGGIDQRNSRNASACCRKSETPARGLPSRCLIALYGRSSMAMRSDSRALTRHDLLSEIAIRFTRLTRHDLLSKLRSDSRALTRRDLLSKLRSDSRALTSAIFSLNCDQIHAPSPGAIFSLNCDQIHAPSQARSSLCRGDELLTTP